MVGGRLLVVGLGRGRTQCRVRTSLFTGGWINVPPAGLPAVPAAVSREDGLQTVSP